MLRLLADENLNNNIVRALQMREPGIDIVRVQDVGLIGHDDPTILAWAAREHRVVITHDAATMTRYAYDRVAAGQPMPGIVAVTVGAPSSTTCSSSRLRASPANGRARSSTSPCADPSPRHLPS